MEGMLFTGKRADNGEWVEGYYVCLNRKEHRIYTGYAETDCGDYYPEWHTVIPETIGRYTALQDKHNRRIFEGHIIKATTPDKTATGFFKIGIGEVEADGYEVIEVYGEDRNGKRGDMVVGVSECYEIIGNIYDNPELLKEG